MSKENFTTFRTTDIKFNSRKDITNFLTECNIDCRTTSHSIYHECEGDLLLYNESVRMLQKRGHIISEVFQWHRTVSTWEAGSKVQELFKINGECKIYDYSIWIQTKNLSITDHRQEIKKVYLLAKKKGYSVDYSCEMESTSESCN